jgi:hypothetical protein
MNQVTFPALVGDSPLAILAAIGTMRLIHDVVDDSARLHWDPADHRPRLISSLRTVDEVAEALEGIVAAMPDGVLVPGGPTGFPPPGEAPDKLRVPRGCLPALMDGLAAGASEAETATLRSWLGSVITDLAVDSKMRGSVSQFIASSGKQSIATMLEKPLERVRKEPDYLRQALVSWRRVSGVTGEYLDHRAAWEATDDGGGKTGNMRGVPGATWLALMSYPLWVTTALRKRARTSGWHSVSMRRRSMQELRLPLWREPLGPAAVKALIEHPALDGDLGEPLDRKIRLLGVFHVCRARRHQPPGSKSAGILTPVSR